MPDAVQESLVDRFGRTVDYVRISVTDRCDFRCVYCMEPDTRFVPHAEVLTLEELALVARAFTELGVKKNPHHRRRAAGPAQRGETDA